MAPAPTFGTGFAGRQRELSCVQSMVLAHRRSTGKNEAVAELDLVPLAEECQEFRQGHVLRRAGEEPCAGPEFARHDVGQRPGRDALRAPSAPLLMTSPVWGLKTSTPLTLTRSLPSGSGRIGREHPCIVLARARLAQNVISDVRESFVHAFGPFGTFLARSPVVRSGGKDGTFGTILARFREIP